MEFLLHHLLIRTAEQYPHHTAVSFQNEKISYQELNGLTNRLAYVLRENGVRRGDRVGIYLNKSIPSIISVFGILKAGAVYVPLDPKAPPARIACIIQNCEVSCLLTSLNKLSTVTGLIPDLKSLKVIVNTDDNSCESTHAGVPLISWKTVRESNSELTDWNSPIETDLAYVLYTSGSTGVPKGVMISHLNALTFLRWAQSTFHIRAQDVVSNHAPLHFDLSILDIFGAIGTGATLALVPEINSTFPVKLVDWINEQKISVWYSVPSILTMMLLQGSMARYSFENLRMILFAGEVFPVKHLRRLMEQLPHVEFYNLYGPTETNVITCYKVENIPLSRELPIPIGKACANMDVFAVRENGEIVDAPDVEGELYARGSCVAQGYWGDLEKTSKNFVWNPLQKNYRDKAYRTGDIVTMDADGSYIFKGRRDHMIKSRGYRIEIGEIENVLYNNPAIREIAVVAVPDEIIGNRIKAFVVCNEGYETDSHALRMYCASRLPQYMIPEEMEFCASLPKTSTGKTDKLVLLKPS